MPEENNNGMPMQDAPATDAPMGEEQQAAPAMNPEMGGETSTEETPAAE